MTKTFTAVAALLALGLASHASAETTAPSVVRLSGQASVTTDYVWRGLSQTWGRPASQVTITADHASGLYASFFGSNVASQFVPNGSLETDWSLGYKANVSNVDWDVGGVYVYYPGANFNKTSFTPAYKSSDPRTLELYVSAATAGFSLRLGYIPTAFFGWNTNNSGVDSVFNSEQPQAGLTGSSKGAWNVEGGYTFNLKEGLSVQATVGHQTIPNSRDISWNYARLGLTADLGNNWSGNVAASFTSQPKAFKSYGSLTNNGERSNPAKNTLILTVNKAF